VNVDGALGDVEVREGVFGVQTATTQLGDPFRALTVHNGATLNLFNLNAVPLNKVITLRDGSTLWNENGNSVVTGPITLEGNVTINAANAGTTPMLTISSPIDGTGNVTKTGSGPLVLSGASSYTGTTTVRAGTMLVDGSHQGGAITVEGGALGGVGQIFSGVIIAAQGALAPGNLNTPISTLTVDTTLRIEGTVQIDINKSGFTLANDFVAGFSAITYGGTLRLNISGDPLVEGDVFTLFTFASASGAFANIVPSSPGPGLAWDASQLSVDGTLRVVIASQPEIGAISLTGTDVTINGTGGAPGAAYHVLTSTNVAVPLINWTPIATNLFDASGNFHFTAPVDPAQPQRFFLLRLP
jgi:autotransporter-associated beta strand protein